MSLYQSLIFIFHYVLFLLNLSYPCAPGGGAGVLARGEAPGMDATLTHAPRRGAGVDGENKREQSRKKRKGKREKVQNHSGFGRFN